MLSSTAVMALLHAFVTTQAMQLLVCQPVGPGTSPTEATQDGWATRAFQSRLAADLDVRCDATAGARAGVGLTILVLFSLGVPVGLAVAVCIRRLQSPRSRY